MKNSNWIPSSFKLDLEFGCLTNAERLADSNPKLVYVEGFARFAGGKKGKWGSHAWCEAPDGAIVDPYLGYIFPDEEIEYRKSDKAFDHIW